MRAIWLPTPGVRAACERARWRVHLIRHRTAFTARIHATLMTFGNQCPVSDLFGARGRTLLKGWSLLSPEPESSVRTGLRLIDVLSTEFDACELPLRLAGGKHPPDPM